MRRASWRRLSLRSRATALATIGFAVLLAASSLLLVVTLDARLTAASDDLSRARLGDLLDLAATGRLTEQLRSAGDEGFAQVVGTQGVVAASGNVAGRPAVADVDPGAAEVVRVLDAPDDAETETYRVWVGRGSSPDGPVTAYVGSSLESVAEASAALRRALWVGAPSVVVVLGALTWIVLGRALRRLDRIRAEVDEITDDRLDRRVQGDGVADEVGRLAATMNAMLSRLEGASQRQRDFVADVSHDLQSPLTAQRVSLELALGTPGSVDPARLREEVLAATSQMELLVGDLLVLAAADRPATAASMLDLDELVLEEVARVRAGTTVEIDTSRVSAAPAYADGADVRRIVRNLLDNAVSHAARRVAVEVVGEQATHDWTSRTTVPASTRSTGTGSSTASTASTTPGRPTCRAAAWGSRSPAPSPSAAAARSTCSPAPTPSPVHTCESPCPPVRGPRNPRTAEPPATVGPPPQPPWCGASGAACSDSVRSTWVTLR